MRKEMKRNSTDKEKRSERREESVSKVITRRGEPDRTSDVSLTHETAQGTLCALSHPSGVV